MVKIWLIRHGATAGNLEKRYIGRTDEALCPRGIVQTGQLAARSRKPDRLFASPMLRTRQTAEYAFPGMAYRTDERLREMDFGLFEGKTAAELEHDSQYRDWLESNCEAPVPGGESVADFKERCCQAFVELLDGIPAGDTAAFVVHGGTIMAVMERFGPEKSFYRWHLGNCGVLCCEWDPVKQCLRPETG